MTLRTGRRRVRPHRVLEDTNAIAHPGPTALEAQRSGQHGQLSGDQMTQIHQRPVARQTRADRSHGGRAARQPVGEQADDKNQNAVDQTNPAAHPAHGAGKFNPIRAQRVRRRLQAARLLGRNHNRLQDVQRPRQARRQAVRQQAERRVTLRTIPASNPRTRRRLALIGPVTGQGAAAVRVERTRLKPCIEPSAGGNVLLAGLPRLIAKLHRPWPGGFLVRAGLSLSVPEDRLRLRPGNTRRTLPTVAHHPGQSINPSMWENRLRFYRTNAGDNSVPRLRAMADSQLVHVSDLYTDEEKKSSETYNALPDGDTQNSLRVRMDGPNGTRIVWTFADPVDEDGWSFDRTGTIERLLPHLRQHVRVRQVLADMGGLRASLATLLDYGATGVIQLNRRGRIVAANDRARDILKRQDGLFDRGGYLCAQAPADNDRLQGLLARALPPSGARGIAGSMVVMRSSGLSRPVLHVTPVGRRDGDVPPWQVAALVLVVEPYIQLPVGRALVEAALDLSPAESRVAVLLAGGRTVREVAVATGRSVNTIRWQIRQIFEKHGLSRLGQLVQLVRSLAGHLGNGR